MQNEWRKCNLVPSTFPTQILPLAPWVLWDVKSDIPVNYFRKCLSLTACLRHACYEQSSEDSRRRVATVLLFDQTEKKNPIAQADIVVRPGMFHIYFIWCFWLEKWMTNNIYIVTPGKLIVFVFFIHGLLRINILNWRNRKPKVVAAREQTLLRVREANNNNKAMKVFCDVLRRRRDWK